MFSFDFSFMEFLLLQHCFAPPGILTAFPIFLDFLFHVSMTADDHTQMIHFIHLLYVFTYHHFTSQYLFCLLGALFTLILIPFLPSTKHLTHCTMYSMTLATYVIHIAVTSYLSLSSYHHEHNICRVPSLENGLLSAASSESC